MGLACELQAVMLGRKKEGWEEEEDGRREGSEHDAMSVLSPTSSTAQLCVLPSSSHPSTHLDPGWSQTGSSSDPASNQFALILPEAEPVVSNVGVEGF